MECVLIGLSHAWVCQKILAFHSLYLKLLSRSWWSLWYANISTYIPVYVITVMCLQCYTAWQTLSTYLKMPTHFIIHCDLSCIVWFSVQCLGSVLSVNVQHVKQNIDLLHHVQEVIWVGLEVGVNWNVWRRNSERLMNCYHRYLLYCISCCN